MQPVQRSVVLTAVVGRGGDGLEPVDNASQGVVVDLDLVCERGLDTDTAANAGADCGVGCGLPVGTVATGWALEGDSTVVVVAGGNHCAKQTQTETIAHELANNKATGKHSTRHQTDQKDHREHSTQGQHTGGTT